MTELTDCALEIAVVKAMGRELREESWGDPEEHTVVTVPSWWRGETWLMFASDWHPLTNAAQAWEVETWLASLSGIELGIWRSQPSNDWCVRVRDWVAGATEIVECAPTRPRAVCLAAVAVGKKESGA